MAGVSWGFGAPLGANTLGPPRAQVFPESITLFPASTFHIQAPTFRHLLRLLAHLSDAHLQASPEAVASTKDTVLRVRPTLQFVKTPFSANDWRTILWMEINNDVPATLPGVWKYTNGDTTQIAYRSAIPKTVKHAPLEGSLIYTFQPELPSLPLHFPALAMYLQVAYMESRKASDSLGTKRLYKVVDQCYPVGRELGVEIGGEDRGSGSKGVGGFLSKFRKKGGKGTDGINEVMYDLVTPFQLGEWG